MKILIALCLITGTAYAGQNDAATSFATGFADGLTQAMGGRRYQAPTQAQVYVPVVPVAVQYEVAAFRQDGSEGGRFINFQTCNTFVRNTYGFVSCQSVPVAY